MKANKIILVIVLFIFTATSYSQEKFLGKVKDFNGEAVAGAVVYVDNKKTDVTTNARGFFEIELPKDTETITVLSPTYGLLTAEYTDQKSLSFVYVNPKYQSEGKLASEKDASSDKISIGYTSVEKKNSAFTTTNIEIDEKDNANAFATIYDLIRSRLKGVRVTRDNRIVIRGLNTLGNGIDPLFVVNGQIVMDISFIRPVEVKEVNVLKGAAASIYGTQAANGVIEITLKS